MPGECLLLQTKPFEAAAAFLLLPQIMIKLTWPTEPFLFFPSVLGSSELKFTLKLFYPHSRENISYFSITIFYSLCGNSSFSLYLKL